MKLEQGKIIITITPQPDGVPNLKLEAEGEQYEGDALMMMHILGLTIQSLQQKMIQDNMPRIMLGPGRGPLIPPGRGN